MRLLGEVKRRYNKWKVEEPERSRKKLERAKTGAERERIRGEIARERMAVREQVAKAKTSLLRAELEKKKAKRALKATGGSGLWGDIGRWFTTPETSTKRRRPSRRKK